MSSIKLIEVGQGRELLKKHCRQNGVSIRLIEELVSIEIDYAGMGRRDGIWDRFDEVIDAHVDESAHVSDTDSAA